MGGRLSKQVGQDASGRWYDECRAMEDRLGYSHEQIYRTWKWAALMREAESVARLPREVCEEMAMLNVIDMFEKRGRTIEVAN